MHSPSSLFSRALFLAITCTATANSLLAAQYSMSLSKSVASVPETAAAPAIVFTIYIGGTRSFPLEIPYQLIAGRAGGAHYGIDYVADSVEPVTGGTLARPGLVIVNPNADRVQLGFRVKSDNFYEGPQSLSFSTQETPFMEFAPGSPRWMEVEINDTETSNTRWLARAFPLLGTVTGLSLWTLNADGLPSRSTGPDYSYQIDKFGGTSRSLALGRLGHRPGHHLLAFPHRLLCAILVEAL
jgi:hypothetical protein